MATASVPELLSETADGILTLTLNRPEVLNALTLGMLQALTVALKKVAADKAVKAVVLTGAGRTFCAGADLGDLKQRRSARSFSLGDELRSHFNPLISRMRSLEKPIIAAMNGGASGAGASLLLAADLKICAEKSTILNSFARVGLVPDAGMTYFLPRGVGYSKALEHLWLAKPVTAEQALACGLVNKVVPAEFVLAEAQALAAELAKLPPLSLALTKRALNRSLESSSLDEQLEYEAQLQDFLGGTKDHSEAVAALIEQRPARLRGE
jgi:2-(1,2-epoxy-1,2-dihydrophenyl)acetyl-CoA isomerase